MKRRDFLFAAAMLAPAMRQASAQHPATKKRLAAIVYGKIEDARLGGAPGLSFSDEGHLHLPQKCLLVQLVEQLRLAAVFSYREFAEAAGLMSYRSDIKSVFRGQVIA